MGPMSGAHPSLRLLFVFPLLACAHPPAPAAPPAPKPVVLEVAPAEALPSLRASLDKQSASVGLTGACSLYWGAAPPPPPSTRPARVVWGQSRIDGYILCDDAAKAAERDSRVHEVAVVSWRSGEIAVGHADEDEIEPLAKVREARGGALATAAVAVFENEGSDQGVDAATLLPALGDLPKTFLYAVWRIRTAP